MEIVNEQINRGKGAYNIHFPHPKYILIFLTAKLGDKMKAVELLNAFKEPYVSRDKAWEVMFKRIEKQVDTL